MKSLIKILKLLFVLVLVVGVVGSIYFGVLGITPAAGAATEVPFEALGKLPFTSVDNSHNNTYDSSNLESNTYTISAGDKTIEYSPEFSLYDFLLGEEMAWRRASSSSTSDNPIDEKDERNYLYGVWDDSEGYSDDGEVDNVISDAIALIKLASYNERTVPYFRTYTDAGGMAVINGGTIQGGLMVQAQEVYNNLGDNQIYWKEQINALANVVASDVIKQAAAIIPALNRATREGRYNNILWEHNGTGIVYTSGGYDEGADTTIPALDNGTCSANWDTTANDKSSESIVYSTFNQSLDASWRKVINKDGSLGRAKVWQEMYSVKYILDLTRDEVYRDSWFSNATIERVYVDDNGADTTEVTENWYLKVSLKADLPEMDDIAPNFNDLSPEKQAEIINKNYMVKAINKDGWKGSGNPTFNDCTWSGSWANNSNIYQLLGYTGADPVCFTKLEYEVEIWNNGLLKKWNTIEGWYGKLVGMTANVKPYSPVVYSYDYSVCTEEIIKDYLVRLTNAKID